MTDGSGGFLLALLTDSFAVRAFIGTLAAAALSVLTIRFAPIHSARGRRLLVLAPVVTAAVAAVASIGSAFLPAVWVMGASTSTDTVVEMLGESRTLGASRSLSVLLITYAAVATVLVARRVIGAVQVHRLLTGAPRPDGGHRAARIITRLAAEVGVRTPDVRLVERCPGGAMTTGRRRPVVALDPHLVAELDDRELEGLAAHELAHLRRADPLVSLLVGLVRDAAFFLPGIHLAGRWLRREQEESADELAATLTRRPAALASGILKVWQRSEHDVPSVACAASGGVITRCRPRVVALVPAGFSPWPERDGSAVITSRVERLISALPPVSGRRLRFELFIGVIVTIVAVVTSLLAPTWFSKRHTDLLGFFYLTSAVPTVSDSPAFATFRSLAMTPGVAHDVLGHGTSALAATSPQKSLAPSDVPDVAPRRPGASSSGARPEAAAVCPCVPTRAQLALGRSASPAEEGMSWGSHAWERQHERNQAHLLANRSLLLMDGSEQQVGFLTAGHRGSTAALPRGVTRP